MESDVARGDADSRPTVRTGRTWHDLPPHPPVGDADDSPWLAPTAPLAAPVPEPTGRRRMLVVGALVGLAVVVAAIAAFALSDDGGDEASGAFGDLPPDLAQPDEPSNLPDDLLAVPEPSTPDSAPAVPDQPGSTDAQPSLPTPSVPQPSSPDAPTAPGSEGETDQSDPGATSPPEGGQQVSPIDVPNVTLTDLPSGYRQTGSFQSVESAGSELAVVAGRVVTGPDGEVRVTARRPGSDELTGDPVEIGGRSGYEMVENGRRQFTWQQDDMTVLVEASDNIANDAFDQLIEGVEVTR